MTFFSVRYKPDDGLIGVRWHQVKDAQCNTLYVYIGLFPIVLIRFAFYSLAF